MIPSSGPEPTDALPRVPDTCATAISRASLEREPPGEHTGENAPDSRSRHADFQEIIEKAAEEVRNARVRANAAPPAPLVTRRQVVVGALAVAVPVLAVLLAVNVFDVSLVELIRPAPSPAIARRQTQEALDAMVRGIEGFREDYAALPESLAEVAAPSPGRWTYTRARGGYRVVLERHGEVATFESVQSKKVLDDPRP